MRTVVDVALDQQDELGIQLVELQHPDFGDRLIAGNFDDDLDKVADVAKDTVEPYRAVFQ